MYVVAVVVAKRDRKKHGMQGFTNSPNVDTLVWNACCVCCLCGIAVWHCTPNFNFKPSLIVKIDCTIRVSQYDFRFGVDGRWWPNYAKQLASIKQAQQPSKRFPITHSLSYGLESLGNLVKSLLSHGILLANSFRFPEDIMVSGIGTALFYSAFLPWASVCVNTGWKDKTLGGVLAEVSIEEESLKKLCCYMLW